MKRSATFWLSLIAPLAFLELAGAQDPSFSLSFDAPARVAGPAGAVSSFQAKVRLTTADNPTVGTGDERGAAGWSVSIGVSDGAVHVVSITTAGTIVDSLYSGGFNKTEVVDPAVVSNPGGAVPDSEVPADTPQGEGAVSGVVLALLEKKELPPEGTAEVAIITLECTAPQTEDACEDVNLSFRNGMKGVGQPVKNTITFKGKSVVPQRQASIVKCCALGLIFDLGLRVQSGGRLGDTEDRTVPVFSSGGGGAAVTVPVGVFLTTDTREDDGPAGFSLSISNGDCLNIVNVTTAGTKVDELYSGGFNKTEVINPTTIANPGGAVPGSEVPADQPQGQGVVSGVVFSLLEKRVLPGVGTNHILQITYELPEEPGVGETIPCAIRFLSGLKGVGQPVKNVLTFKGGSKAPTAQVDFRTEDGGIIFEGRLPPADQFIRGNANDDRKVDIADGIWIINELFRGGQATLCPEAADADDDGMVSIGDAIFIINYQFLGGAQPSAPFPNCGFDQDSDDLDCPPDSTTSCP